MACVGVPSLPVLRVSGLVYAILDLSHTRVCPHSTRSLAVSSKENSHLVLGEKLQLQ
jgi:hypothetical protein